MTVRPTVLAWLGLQWGVTGQAFAQSDAPYAGPACGADTQLVEAQLRQDSAVAYRFAPVLWFAPTELDFPTMPFFTVWDTFDNDGDGLVDFRDSTEVAMLNPRGLASWDAGLAFYRKADASDPARTRAINLARSSVFYRVCDLSRSQVDDLYRILRLDEQAWQRLQLDYDFPPPWTDFRVVEYHLYYFRDSGLQGHPHDTEKVFVFTPRDTGIGFWVVVGAGHTNRVPNNVLIRFAPREGARILTDTLQVLVELGGHSSAPNLYPRGRFQAGADANWQMYDLWGTRDVQAAGGIGYLGNYGPGMGFVRDPDDPRMVRLYPPRDTTIGQRKMESAEHLGLGSDSARAPLSGYRLVPMSSYRRLIERLDEWDGSSRPPEELPLLVAEIQRALGHESSPFTSLTPLEQKAALRVMKQRWAQPLLYESREEQRLPRETPGAEDAACAPLRALPQRPRDWSPAIPWRERADARGRLGARCYTDPRKHRIWESPAYTDDPTLIFKEHLFRPTVLSLTNHDLGDWLRLVTYGMTRYGAGAWDLHFGFVVPAYRSHWVPVRLPGFVELQAGWYTSDLSLQTRNTSFYGSLQWELHRNAWVTAYIRPRWVPRRSEALCNCDAPSERFSDFSIGAGVSLLPVMWRKRPSPVFLIPNVVRIAIGLGVDLGDWGDATRRLAWEIQFRTRQ